MSKRDEREYRLEGLPMSDSEERACQRFAGSGLRRGPEWLIIDPFTPDERAVLADSEEGRAWSAAHPPTGKPLWITGVDLEKRAITFGTEPPKRRKAK
jgi:hypothetical protein